MRDTLVRDIRYAVRGLWRDRPYTVTTVVTLAAALSLITVVFTVFNAYVLRPFAVHDPHSLYEVGWRSKEAGGRRFAWRDVEALSARKDLFTDVLAEATRVVSSDGRRLNAGFVSGGYLEGLRARIRFGRPISRADAAAPGESPVAVLTDEGWARLFDRDPAALGRTLELNGVRAVVIGIATPEFAGLDDLPRDVWLPLTMYPSIAKAELFGPSQPRSLVVTVRLRPDVTPEQAQHALAPLVADGLPEQDGVRAELQTRATPAPLTLELLAVLSPVFVAFALVLLTACANVSNIMMARANARHREIGVRLALGAGRRHIAAQLLTEGALLATCAGLLAIGLARLLLELGTKLLFLTLPPLAASMTRVVPLEFDTRVFLFAGAVAAITTIGFALAPALQAARVTLTPVLRGEAGQVVRTSRLRAALVAAQVAVSLVLLVAASTVLRNSLAIAKADLGMRTSGIVSINQRAAGPTAIHAAAAALQADRRMAQVVATSRNPLFGQVERLPAVSPATRQFAATSVLSVSPDYFGMLGIGLLHGRTFSEEESQSESNVGVISAAAARTFFPDGSAVGSTLRVVLDQGPRSELKSRLVEKQTAEHAGTEITIVGIAADVVSGLIYEGTDRALLYLPTHPGGRRAAALLVRGATPADVRSRTLQEILQRVHPDPLAFEAVSLEEILTMQMYPMRVASWIGTLLCGIALALSVSGIYGLVAYALTQRRKEIGIRMALGASAAGVVRLLMTQSARLVAWGVLLGGFGSFTALGLLAAAVRLDNVRLLDAGAFAASVFIIGAAAGAATYYPARQAARIEPAVAIRD